MNDKLEKIVVKKEDRQKIKDLFGCSESVLSMALNFRSNSELARKIRHYAINRMKKVFY